MPDPMSRDSEAQMVRDALRAFNGAEDQEDYPAYLVDALHAAGYRVVAAEGETELRAAAEAVDRAMQASIATEFLCGTEWAEDKRWVPAEALADLPLPCPVRSSLTDQPCVLAWGHEPDIGRFHRFAAPTEEERQHDR